jgi:hypothetical protein
MRRNLIVCEKRAPSSAHKLAARPRRDDPGPPDRRASRSTEPAPLNMTADAIDARVSGPSIPIRAAAS